MTSRDVCAACAAAVAIAACAIVFVWPAGGAENVALTVTETAGVDRTAEPVTTGFPLAKGAVKDLAGCGLLNDKGAAVPAQFKVLSSWPDGSVRWALVDFQADVKANGKGVYSFAPAAGGRTPAPPQPVKVDNGADTVTVSTGPMTFTVDKKKFALFSSLKVNGKDLIRAGSGVEMHLAQGGPVAVGAAAPREVVVEEAGPLRAVVKVAGPFGDLNGKKLDYIARITAYAGLPVVKVKFTLRNLGGYGYNNRGIGWNEWFEFDGCAINLDLTPYAAGGAISAACEETEAAVKAGERWAVEQRGEKPNFNSMKFEVVKDGRSLKSGQTTDGVTRLTAGGQPLTVAVWRFWQNYEKSVELNGTSLAVWLWPRFGEWPRMDASRGNIDEGRRAAGLYHLPGGNQKSHEVLLDFRSAVTTEQSAATLSQPLMALASPKHFADTEAFGLFAEGDFAPPDANAASAARNQNDWARNCFNPKVQGSVHSARRGGRAGFWLGWMDFGDLCWSSSRGDGPCSLHYDWTWIGLLDYMRLGDRYFLDTADEMARHRMDIDQRWSDRDHPVYRGLCSFEMSFADIHGGNNDGHNSPAPSHNWDAGLVLYHLLTGDAMAREAAIRNCDVGIYLRVIEPFTKGQGVDRQPRDSGWSIEDLIAAYEMTNDKKYLDWALLCWDVHLKARWKSDGVRMEKGGKYSLQMFYLAKSLIDLHRLTGQKDILDYIEATVKEADEHRNEWEYGNELGAFFSNYWGYLAVVKNDPKLLEKAREYFEMRVPVKAGRLVFETGTRANTKEVAKALRNGHVWLWAEKKLAAQGK